jgi:hypothetical protein
MGYGIYPTYNLLPITHNPRIDELTSYALPNYLRDLCILM